MQRPREGGEDREPPSDNRRRDDGRRQEGGFDGGSDRVGIVTQPTLNPAFAVGTVTKITDAELTVSSDDGANFWVLSRDEKISEPKLLSRVRYSTGPTGSVSLVGSAVDAHESVMSAARVLGVVTQPISATGADTCGSLNVLGGPLAGKMVQFSLNLSGPALETATAGTFAVFYVVRVSDDRLVALSTRVTSSGASNLWEGVIISVDVTSSVGTARYWSQGDQQVGGEIMVFSGDNPRVTFRRGSRFEFEATGEVESVKDATQLATEMRRGIIVPDGGAADTFALRRENKDQSLSLGNEVTFIPIRGKTPGAIVVSSKAVSPPTSSNAPRTDTDRTSRKSGSAAVPEDKKQQRSSDDAKEDSGSREYQGVICRQENRNGEFRARYHAILDSDAGGDAKVRLSDNRKLRGTVGQVFRFWAPQNLPKHWEVRNARPVEPRHRKGVVKGWDSKKNCLVEDVSSPGIELIAPEYFHRHGWFKSREAGDPVNFSPIFSSENPRREILVSMDEHTMPAADRPVREQQGRPSASAAAPQQQPSAPRPSAGGSSAAAAGVVTRPKFCMECGTKIVSDTQKFCTECGTPIVGVPR